MTSKFRTTILAAALAGLGLSPAATAATFNFADMADTYFKANRFEGSFDQVARDPATSSFFTDDGISLIGASATGTKPRKDAHGFFDAGHAGLGVCSNGFFDRGIYAGASRCATPFGNKRSDDNLTRGEALSLTFGEKIRLDSLRVLDKKHRTIGSGHMVINGQTFGISNSFVQNLGALAASPVFTFQTTRKTPQIYLNATDVAAVPLPAGLALLGTALGGLTLVRRRRKTA